MRIPALLLVASLVFAGTAQAAPPDRATLQRSLDRVVSAGAPGAVLVVRDGARTMRLASGYSVVKGKVKANAADRFRIGSVTKTFVATVVLQLVGEGVIALDDPVQDVMPGTVTHGSEITVRDLLQQTSGLPDYLADPKVFAPYLRGNVGYVWTPQRLLALANRRALHFKPGSKWEYSNTNYLVLGLLVEAVTGHSLATELQHRVFDRAGLHSTRLEVQPTIAGRHMHGYLPMGGKLTDVSVVSPSAAWAAGGISSTADDVARFYRALLGGRLLRPALLSEMERTVPMGAPGESYGFGLWRTRTMALTPTPLPCGPAWGHNGGWVGYMTNAFNSRDGKRQFVLFVNVDEGNRTPKLAEAMYRVGRAAYCGLP